MSIAPTIGGVTAHYYSWRTTQYGLCVAGIASFLLTLCFQPETAWPGARGVDKLIEKEGRARWVWLNPFGSIALLRSPNVLLLVSTRPICAQIEWLTRLAVGLAGTGRDD